MSAAVGGRAPRPRVRVATVEAELPEGGQSIEFGSAEEWRVLVMHDGRPLHRVELPDPGRTTGDGIVQAAVVAACSEERRRLRLAADLRRRLGAPELRYPTHGVSVIVCTRGRLESIRALLGVLTGLDPAPDEIVVVDNAPRPGEDCREVAKAAGAVYVREDVLGLNSARRAGLAAARGELLAFTDDDCLPPTGWLAALPELFDDRNLTAVTGPTLPATLDTPSRVRFEEVATFSRGFRRLEFDCMSLSPPEAVRVGAGANMIFRRSHVDEMGEIFPPELDAGTPTRSGGDYYAFYRVLAAGRRIVYDPRVFTYHLHREDPASLHGTIYGYGVGLSAVATKVLLEDGELAAVKIWRWMAREYARSVLLGVAGRLDAAGVRMRWDYARGALMGPAALYASRRHRRRRSADAQRPPRAATPAAKSRSRPPAGEPEVSVVVIARRPPDVAYRCLEALGTQDGSSPRFEVVAVDDSVDGAARGLDPPPGLNVTALATKGAGPAAARNAGAGAARGQVLLFLDDDVVPAQDLVARHAVRHRADEADRVVIGYSPPRPTRPTLAALSASLWWEDHFRAKRDAAAWTFVDVLSANLSVRRETFARIGPFDPRLGRFGRDHWEWGVRALLAGAQIAYEPDAVAFRHLSLDTRRRIAAARAEGHGDALLLERYPFVRPSLPVGFEPASEASSGRLLRWLLRHDRVRDKAVVLLEVLERMNAREAWASVFEATRRAAYEQGFREGGGDRRDPGAGEVVPLELDSSDPLPRPTVAAPMLAVTVRGVAVGIESPREGQWNGALAERIAGRVPGRELKRLEEPRRARSAPPSGLRDVTLVLPSSERHTEATAAIAEAGGEVRDGAWGEPRWEAVDDAIRGAGRPLVAMPLSGAAPGPGWPGEALVAFEGERVAAVVGRGLGSEDGGRPLTLHRRGRGAPPYSAVGIRPQYLVVRRASYIALGGFEPRLGRFSEEAPILDLIERALAAGWIVGRRDTAGLDPPGGVRDSGWHADWVLGRTRGVLLARDAREEGRLWLARWGGVSVAANLWRAARPTASARRPALVTAAAVALGCLQGAADAQVRGGRGGGA